MKNKTANNYTYIILAGGKSTRMGVDKAFLKFGNTTLIAHLIEQISLVAHEIICVTNHAHHQDLPYMLFEDEVKDVGPLGGIYTGLKNSITEWNFVLSCDTPFVLPEMVTALSNQLENHVVIIPKYNEKEYFLMGFYHKSVLPIIEKQLALKDFKLSHFLELINTKIIDCSQLDKKGFLNINTPEEYEAALKLYSE